MKKPEETIKRGEGNFYNCTDYDDAIDAMKVYGQECAIEFLEWIAINGWRKLEGVNEYSDGERHKTPSELYDIFINPLTK